MMRRTAAALLLTRGEGAALEVFLVERSPELKFFGGYHALPGGVLAPVDGDAAADADAAMQACALRELFEETGLLRHNLRGMAGSNQELRRVRQAMLGKDGEAAAAAWRGLVAAAKAPSPLRELCRVETPPFAPVRYDTAFFHVPLERCRGGTMGPHPDVWPGELTGGRFRRAGEALRAWRAGELWLVPPVVILLELLAGSGGDFEAFAETVSALAADYRRGRLHQVRFTPGVVLAALRSPTLPPATTTNCYVVGTQELWAIDPGSPHAEEQERLLALLAELRAGGAKLAGILLTHHHEDHTGGVAALSRALDLEVRGHPLTLSRTPGEFRRGAPLHDGDRVALGLAPDGRPGWELVAIHTPGHDRGHLCFRETRYDAVIVGDMLSTMSTIVIDPPEGHLTTYLRSLERLLQEPMRTLYPAHGPALRDGHKLVQHYIRHRAQRETALLEALRQAPATVAQLVPRVYWDTDVRMHGIAARSLLAGLQKLQEEGRASERGGVWGPA